MRPHRRKYRRQMARAEIAFVEALVHRRSKWTAGKHARDSMSKKDIRYAEVVEVLATGYVVEVNEVNDLCLLFRKEFDDHAVCVVVKIATQWIVTVWKNDLDDNHKSLDRSKYRWREDMRQHLAAFAV